MAAPRPVGIDLGTTFSAVATLDAAGRSTMLRNAEGELLTPSVVLFGDRQVVVGKEARNAAIVEPDVVAEWVKRDMGAPRYSRPIRGEYLPPEVIQACILRKLRADIVSALGADVAVVITVPAYFDEPRRKATADAGEMAGLRVLDIVNEPTAAALAFGETLGYLSPGGTPRQAMTVLVYDLGGGTFDVTLLRLAPGDVHTIATDGDVQLGGHDWDLRLLEYVADAFQKAHHIDPRQDPRAANRLLSAVIDAKHALSARSRTTLRVEYQGRSTQVVLTRELFADLTADLLERTSYTTRQLLIDAGLDWQQVDQVLLVGGSTRMPMVVDLLKGLSGKEPARAVNPDEAVARGAALYAGYLLAKQGCGPSEPTFEVTNVNSHSLGIEGIDPQTLRKTNVVLIPRNTPLPARRTERFATKTENQRSIVVQVLEGESSLPGECTAIGRTVIRDLPAGLPKGWPIEVTFEYGANGRLRVEAVVPGTTQAAHLELERASGLTDVGISRWKLPVDTTAGFAAFREASAELLAAGGTAGAAAGTPAGAEAGEADWAQSAAGTAPAAPAAPGAAGQIPRTPPVPPPQQQAASPGAAPMGGRQGALPQVSTAEKTGNAGGLLGGRMIGVLGYISSAIAGLVLGYLVLHLLRPEHFPLPW